MEVVKDYHQLVPEAPYDLYVARAAHAHFMAPVPPERLAPDGYIKLSVLLGGDPIYTDALGDRLDWSIGFAGHMSPDRPVYVSSNGPVHVIWLNFLPSGFYRLFGKRVNAFTERFVRPEEVLGTTYGSLCASLAAESDPAERPRMLLDAMFAEQDMQPLAEPAPMQRIEQHIRATHGTATVTELADIADISTRQLERRSLIELGATPKAFSSIVRFNHAYQLMKAQQKLDLDIALHCGYYDESHMLRDLAYYLGGTSKQYVDLVRPVVDRNLGH